MSIKNINKIFNISRITLLNWEKQGLIKSYRTPGGQRRFKKEDIERLLELESDKTIPKVVLYARVSTRKQEMYLSNQIERLKKFAEESNFNDYEIISEIASGVNENRRGLNKLLNKVKNGEVDKIIIEYPDRLARFGFNYLKKFFDSFGVELIIINESVDNNLDINKELADDLIAIVTSFSARIYGARGGKKK